MASLGRLTSQQSRVLKFLGYPLFAVAVFIGSLYYSLPRDRIRERLERELSQEPGPSPFGSGGFGIGLGMDVQIGELDLHLLSPGVSATAVQLQSRKPVLGSPIAPPPGAPPGGKDDKGKNRVKPLFIDRLDVRLPLTDVVSGNKVADVDAEAFGGTIRGIGGINGEGLFVDGHITELVLGRIPNLGQLLPLPMTGTLSVSLTFKAPPTKLPPGAPPPRPGAPPTFDMPHAAGVLEVQLKEGTLGDGVAKLVVPGDPFLSQGLTFPRLRLGSLIGRVVVDRGRATFDELHGKSPDAELWIDGYLELRDPVPNSELHLYVRFKPSAELVKREATIEILNNAMGQGKRADGALGFAVTGSLAAPRSRPAKDPPDGLTVRAGTMGQVATPATPALRPGGSMGSQMIPVARPIAEPPPRVNIPQAAPEPPPPPPPPQVAAPIPQPPQQQQPPSMPMPVPTVSPPPAEPTPSQPPSSEARPAEKSAVEPATDPPPNFPSHQRGF